MVARIRPFAAFALLAIGGCAAPPETDLPFRKALCLGGLDVPQAEIAQIPVGGCVISPSGRYAMVMHASGALDLAPIGADGRPGSPVWTSASAGARPNSAIAVLQPDGNLVVYDQPGDRPIWNTGATHPLGDYRLEVSDQGEILVRPAAGAAVWSSRRGALPPPSP